MAVAKNYKNKNKIANPFFSRRWIFMRGQRLALGLLGSDYCGARPAFILRLSITNV